MNSSQIGKVIGANPATIRKIKSRANRIINLLPKEKKSKTKINARVCLPIKKIVIETLNVAIRKIPGILREWLPNEPCLPQKTVITDFLKVNGFVKRALWLKCPINERNKIKRLDFANFWPKDGKIDKVM